MRRLLLLFAVYVTLDVANPLMPGAVRFEEGAIRAVQADRPSRPLLPVVPAVRTGQPLRPAAPLAEVTPATPSFARPIPAAPSRLVRRVGPSRRDAPPPPAEDH